MNHMTSRTHSRRESLNPGSELSLENRQRTIGSRFLRPSNSPDVVRYRGDPWHLQGPIPHGVEAVGNNKNVFTIPLSEIPDLNRIALGIRDSARHLVVRIQLAISRYNSVADFCIHLPPGDNKHGLYHIYNSGFSSDENTLAGADYSKEPCNSHPNFFTHLLAEGLQNVLQGQEESLRVTPAVNIRNLLIWLAQEASSHVTKRCIISSESCRPSLGFTAARPIACSPKCRKEFEKWPLVVRISPLLRDPSVLDLLLTCLTAQLRSLVLEAKYSYNHPFANFTPPLVDCPYDAEIMLKIINSFPMMDPSASLDGIARRGWSGSESRRTVLSWLCSRFEGMMIPTPPKDEAVFHMPLPNKMRIVPSTFLLLNTNVDRQVAFKNQLAKHRQDAGGAAFHGTPPQTAFTILCEGLKQNAFTGDNVYYSDDPLVSTYYMWARGHPDYLRAISAGWKNSRFRGHQVLFGVEYAGLNKRFPGNEENSHQDTLMVRQLFLFPAAAEGAYRGTYGRADWAQRYSVRPTMEKAFRRVHNGDLIRDILEEKRT
ncbi:hypothetical protein PG985_000106 [Apiospora marii]|uniref:uncharacterized protein n=1 Tax=Apiospora marii TaxID=335849 RepID=UPI0031305ABE